MTVSAYDHPDWQAFVAAVRKSPEDDTPRLVAADWLDEHGEADRAELVRVQCALARLVFAAPSGWALRPGESYAALHSRLLCECDSCQAAGPLRTREAELLGGPNPRLFGKRVWASYVRGFCESVRAPWEAWGDHADQLLRREPVRSVELTTRPQSNLEPPWPLMWLRGRPLTLDVPAGATVEAIRRAAEDLLAIEWSGVTFTLPPEPVGRAFTASMT